MTNFKAKLINSQENWSTFQKKEKKPNKHGRLNKKECKVFTKR